MTRRVAIAATGPASLGAGLALAREGGNAVDAAVAAALATMSTEPGIVSLGGGAFISIWAPGADPILVDGNVEMPGRGADPARFGGGVSEIHTAYGGGVTLYAGYGSVGVPGALPACQLAVEEHGDARWSDVVAPAVRACREGYPVGRATAHYLGFVAESLFSLDADARALVTRDDGTPLRAGDTGCNPALADVLELVGREGASVATIGEVGRALAAVMDERGGLVTQQDLAEYDPVIRTPTRRRVGQWDLAFNPPPSVGGPMLAAMMGELGRRGYWHWPDVIEIQRAVLGYRLRVHDLATDLDAAGHELLRAVERHGLAGLPTSSSTAHISAVDSDGIACAVTTSAGYGAGVTIPGTGMLLNNALGEPELNKLGLHRLAPGTRMASNMAPTTGRTDDGRVLAIGSPGADRITTALMQVLGQGCLHDADLQHAITAPRVHVRFDAAGEPVIEHESDPGIAEAVAGLGLPSTDHGELSMYFGGVGAAYRLPGGELMAAGDPRREAAVGVA